MKLAVLGSAKSGTTALFAAIREALGPDVDPLYEPRRSVDFGIVSRSTAAHVLVKFFLSVALQSRIDLSMFDKVVLITRDPRDVVVSHLLFNASLHYRSRRHLRKMIGLLREKERHPGSLSLLEIAGRLARHTIRGPNWEFLSRQLNFGLELSAGQSNVFTLRYEDFVDGRVAELQKFLGLELAQGSVPRPWLDQVARTKGYGQWRHWFLDRDRAYFEPLFADYIATCGYDSDWRPHPQPQLDPAHGSAYIARAGAQVAGNPLLVRRGGGLRRWLRRLRARLPAPIRGYLTSSRALASADASIKMMQSAADDGKVSAIRRLGQSYLAGAGVPIDRERGLALLRRAADYGDAAALIQLSELRSAQNDPGAQAEARTLLEEAARHGSAEAHYRLARLHLETGGPEPTALARKHFRRASKLGHRAAARALASLPEAR